MFQKWQPFDDLEVLEIDGFSPDITDDDYRKLLRDRFVDRLNFIKSRASEKGGYDALPSDAADALASLIERLK